jgi:hypothetical protein
MKISTQQITGRGIAQQSGLETFSSITNYTGDYVNFGDAFDYGNQLSSDTNYATTTATPHISALDGSPPSVINKWYRYYSSGVLYTNAGSATSSKGYFSLPSILTGGLPSYCGMYQKLLLTTGKEYKVRLQTTFDIAIGTLYINTYTPSSGSYILTSTTSKLLPNTSGTLGFVESTFTAQSGNDIILIYATTTEASSQDLLISNISIQEKQEYLTPVYATDMWGNAHKVLRVAADQIISDD